ncbi:MAG: hypothetical protein ACKO86_14010, partial [Dolichospermum sp.]
NRVLIDRRDYDVIRGNPLEYFAYPQVCWQQLNHLVYVGCVWLDLHRVFLLEVFGYCTLLQIYYSRIQYLFYHGSINIVNLKG